MIKAIVLYDGDSTAYFEETDEKKQLLWDKMIEFCRKHNSDTGESVQNDDFNIDSPQFMAEVIDDIIKFERKWKDD